MIALLLNPAAGLAQMLGHPFIRDGFIAGTGVALACGLVGYFAVLRGQVFTGDALSHAAFTGALAALALGLDARLGLFGVTVAVALGMGLLGARGRADDVVIGNVFAWVLGLGVLFLAIYTTQRSSGNGAAGPAVLFGSIFGLSAASARLALLIGLATAIALLVLARPLLFASVDEAVAAAQGVPVRGVGLLFLALIGLAAAEGAQVVGALLVLGLLSAPAAAAQRLVDRPYVGLALSAALALLAMWGGLTLSYAVPRLPPSFAIIATATAIYAVAALLPMLRRLRPSGRRERPAAARAVTPSA
ncbi:MAG TPA: metal ABC transporter permease [Dehalococcoidia bacterium]|nr:metal ABC transporter permease [Dehalococcoidia bacterium]